jgi:hypothetical protein
MNTDYYNYAKVVNGRVVVRYSVAQPWGQFGRPPDQAREFGAYIVQLADDAERDNPCVRQLAEDLEEADHGSDKPWADIALALIRKGYRK